MNLPEAFIKETHKLMGDQLFATLTDALCQPPAVSIRLNPQKIPGRSVVKSLASDPVPWCRYGHYLQGRPHFTFDPLFHAGCYYVQEASSMFIDEVVRQLVHQPVLALDLCAAPGGKSTALRTALPEGSLLVCNEPVRQRAHILSENMQKWGNADVMVTNHLPSDFCHTDISFDLILTDVPCSGEGMFRKDEDVIGEWSEQNVRNCQTLQREIVGHAWQCLRPGGLLIYSTCTYNIHEDEDNILWAKEELGAEILPIETRDEWNITPSLSSRLQNPVYRFIPGVSRGEGLFMAFLRKSDTDMGIRRDKKTTKRPEKNKKSPVQKDVPTTIKSWLSNPHKFTFREEGQELRAIPTSWIDIYEKLKGLKVLHAGIGVGNIRGKDIIPSPSLGLSVHLNSEAFERHELDYPQAIAYLRKEAITLSSNVTRGFVLLTYRGTPLGFVKNIGIRANNLYPQEWKIRSGHQPNGICDIIE